MRKEEKIFQEMQWLIGNFILNKLRLRPLFERLGIIQPLPKPEPPKTIQQLTLKEKTKLIEQKRSEQGWVCCHNCGRSAGMRYGKKSEEGKGITIKTVKVYEDNILVKRNYCTDCLSKGGGENG